MDVEGDRCNLSRHSFREDPENRALAAWISACRAFCQSGAPLARSSVIAPGNFRMVKYTERDLSSGVFSILEARAVRFRVTFSRSKFLLHYF